MASRGWALSGKFTFAGVDKYTLSGTCASTSSRTGTFESNGDCDSGGCQLTMFSFE